MGVGKDLAKKCIPVRSSFGPITSMSSLFFCILVILGVFLPSSTYGLYEDQAGVLDWNIALIGVPKYAYPIDSSSSSSSPSVVFGTDKNVVASLNVETSQINWRQQLPYTLTNVKYTDNIIITTSTTSSNSSFIHCWDASSGFLNWETPFSNDIITAVEFIYGREKPLAVLVGTSNGSVKKMGLHSGSVAWSANIGNTVAAFKVTPNDLHVVSTSSQHQLSLASGKIEVSNTHAHSTDSVTTDNGLSATLTSGSAISVQDMFTPQKSMKIRYGDVFPGDSTFTKVLSEHDSARVSFPTSKHAHDFPCIITESKSHIAIVIIDRSTMTVKKSFNVPKKPMTALSVYFRGSDILSTSVSHESLKIPVKSFGPVKSVFAFEDSYFVTTSDGSLHCYSSSNVLRWVRHEGLSTIIDDNKRKGIHFVELPDKSHHGMIATVEQNELGENVDDESRYGILEQWRRRWMGHADSLVEFILNAPSSADVLGLLSKTKSTSSGKSRSVMKSYNTTTNNLMPKRDKFGLRKLAVVVTSRSTLTAFLTDSGDMAYQKYLPNYVGASDMIIHKIALSRETNIRFPPLISVMYSLPSDPTTIHVMVLNVMDGSVFDSVKPWSVSLNSDERIAKILETPYEDAESRVKVLSILISDKSGNPLRAAYYPSTPKTESPLHFWDWKSSKELVGMQLSSDEVVTNWKFALAEGEEIVEVGGKQECDKIATLGRVLGDRTVLYKYLSPTLLPVITVQSHPSAPSAKITHIYLIDSVTGNIHWNGLYPMSSYASESNLLLRCENWVVAVLQGEGYVDEMDSLTLQTQESLSQKKKKSKSKSKKKKAESDDGQPEEKPSITNGVKGTQIVVLEVYESDKPDERISDPSYSAFSPHQPHVIAQSFLLPLPVVSIGVTETRAGITTREVLFGLGTNQILGIKKQPFLDPRRPKGALSEFDKEEMLIPYSPILPISGRDMATYHLEVMGPRKLYATSTMLESTSLLFSHGLDIFMTRRMPSATFDILSEDFSKALLVLSILGVSVGIVVVKRLVKERRVKEAWK